MEKMTNLEKLDLSDNQIVNLEGVATLENLVELDLRNNRMYVHYMTKIFTSHEIVDLKQIVWEIFLICSMWICPTTIYLPSNR